MTRIGLVLSQQLGCTGSGIFTLNLASGLHLIQLEAKVLSAAIRGSASEGHRFPVDQVEFETNGLAFPIPGMSDVMPYRSTIFSQMSDADVDRYLDHWQERLINFVDSGVDYLHVNHWWLVAGTAVQSVSVPVAVTLHGTDLDQWEKAPWLVSRARLREHSPRQFHAVSNSVLRRAKQLGIPVRGAVVIPPPYREDIFTPDATVEREPGHSVFTGKLSGQKGIAEVLQSFAMLRRHKPRATLAVIGNAPQGIHQWEVVAGEYGLTGHVSFLGQLSQERLADEFRRAEVLIMASRAEGFGMVAVEAAACGARVVMPRHSAADELLEETLRPGHVFCIAPLERVNWLSLRRFVTRLADAWQSALDAGPLSDREAVRSALEERLGRVAVARRMAEQVYRLHELHRGHGPEG